MCRHEAQAEYTNLAAAWHPHTHTHTLTLSQKAESDSERGSEQEEAGKINEIKEYGNK